jgi:F-type H+-transporting ATPase subunit gamma
MKMVAASKLKRAREKAEAAAPYADKMHEMLAAVAKSAGFNSEHRNLLTGSGNDKVHLFVIITADRGLCGAFNLNLVKYVRKVTEQFTNEGKTVKFLCVGKKGYEALKKYYPAAILAHRNLMSGKQIAYQDAHAIAQKAISLFFEGEIDYCHVFYSKFKSVIAQVPNYQQLIPLPEDDAPESCSLNPYEFEPNEDFIVEKMLPKNVGVQFFRALLETSASEHGARMTAMDNATRNSGEMIKKLNLVYNRTRQAVITKELIEIISGAEAI